MFLPSRCQLVHIHRIHFFLFSCRHQDLVDKAIRDALKNRPSSEMAFQTNLTPPDHFYRQISKIEDFVEGFQRVEQESFVSNRSTSDVVASVYAVNKIILVKLSDNRNKKSTSFVAKLILDPEEVSISLPTGHYWAKLTPAISDGTLSISGRSGSSRGSRDTT